MAAPTYPPPLLEPVAADAGGAYITDPMPEAPTGSNAASIQGGFPPVTMQPELGGGKPPLGQDMNGFLFMITTHTVWVQSGQLYLFNSALAADIGGYAIGTILGMADGSGIWLNVTANNTTNPDTGGVGAGWRPLYSYGSATVPITGPTTVLTAAQAKKPVIILTGVLSANTIVYLPQYAQEWLIVNGTSGAFNVTVNAGGGTTVTVPQGGFASPIGVYSVGDGNLYPTVAPLSIPIDQAATPLTIVQRTNAGYVLATYFNQSSAFNENPPIGSVAVQNTGLDGYFRFATLAYFEASMALSAIGGQVTNGQVPYSVVQQWAATLFTSPAFTGVPTAPTAPAGTATSQIATTAFVNQGGSISGNGWRQNSDGSIEQWGTFPWTANGGTTTIAFPRTFPNAIFSLVNSVVAPSGLGGAGSYQADMPSAPGTASFQYHSISSSNPAITVHWRAIGN